MMIHYLTNTPKGENVVLASCDSTYLRRFAPSFVASALVNGMSPHIHLIDPTPDDVNFAYGMNAASERIHPFGDRGRPSFSMEHGEFALAKIAYNDRRTYFACNRFLAAPYIMKRVDSLYISDIDAVWKKTPVKPAYQVGLYLRDPLPGTVGWEQEGTHVAAGLVYARGVFGRDFIWDASQMIKELTDAGNSWFSDQVALWRVYNKFRAREYRVHTFDSYDMDWEFTPNSCMWTAKGDRKNSKVYIDEQLKYARMLQS